MADLARRKFPDKRRKSPKSMSPAERTSLEMQRLKLEAIEKGELTDFSFLVGPDKDTDAEVRLSVRPAVLNFDFSARLKAF